MTRRSSHQQLILDSALQYAGRGWRVFAAKIERQPDGKWTKSSWTAKQGDDGFNWDASTDPAKVRENFTPVLTKAGVGIATGADSKIFIVETDVPDGHPRADGTPGPDGAANLRALEAQHTPLPPTLMGTSPSHSVHLYFQHPLNGLWIKNSTSLLAPGVDVRGDGGMVIAPPTKRGEGVYKWLNDLPVAEAPQWLLQRVVRAPSAAPSPNEDLESDPELVALALKIIPNDDVAWDDWNRVGMATFAATGGTGEGLFDAWSRKSALKYDERRTADKWRALTRSPPDRIGAGTLFFMASQVQPGWADDYHERTWQILTNRAPPHPPTSVQSASSNSPAPPASAPPPPRSVLWRHGDPLPAPPRWLLHRVIPEIGTGILLGQFSGLKTTTAIDLAVAVATGSDWAEQTMRRRGGVLYVALEGGDRFPYRLKGAIMQRFSARQATILRLNPERLPIVRATEMPKLMSTKGPAFLIELAAQAQAYFQDQFGVDLVLIEIDTLSKAAGWEREDDNVQAQRVVDAMELVARTTNTFVMALHHFGKDPARGSRGASSTEATTDLEIRIDGDKNSAGELINPELNLFKIRDEEGGRTIPFEKCVVEVGTDEEGEPIRAPAINWHVPARSLESATAPRADTVGKRVFDQAMRLALTERHGAEIPNGEGVVTAVPLDKLRNQFDAIYLTRRDVQPRSADKAFLRGRREAGAQTVLHNGEDWVWVPPRPATPGAGG